jgi:DNA phosphorothioation-associated putative methyltransferase
MRPPGKTVVDEFYVHLTALEHVESSTARAAIERAVEALPQGLEVEPNVAKFNLRSGRVSLLAYPGFFDDPFPELVAAWIFPPEATGPTSHRRYDDSLNPPILHRKELLLLSTHSVFEEWAALTATAESLGLFDNVATIGFRLNWQRLISSKGYQLVDRAFVPIGNDLGDDRSEFLPVGDVEVQRHLTALSRSSLSAPVQLSIRLGLLAPTHTFFDYGCGKGGDVAALCNEGYDAQGWDPHFAPNLPKVHADIVNLGFVVNVIEDPAERIEALTNAFSLAHTAMVVGVMLYGGDLPGKPFRDGYLTSRGTFQKYFTQAELKGYLEDVLQRRAILIGPGVALIFKDSDAEQRFTANRYRSKSVSDRLLAARVAKPKVAREPRPQLRATPHTLSRGKREPKPFAAESRLQAARPVLDRLWAISLDLGRYPEPDEVPEASAVGSLPKALRLLVQHYDQGLLSRAASTRSDDVRLLMATHQFAKTPSYRQLELRLQRDIKAFFGDYKSAQDAGRGLLTEAADPTKILSAARDAARQGIGWIDAEHSLQLHVSMVDRLPVILRAYVACGLILWDALGEIELVKIHIGSGKLTLMEFDDFDRVPLPLLRRRIKVNLRRLDYDIFEYGSQSFPKPLLYRKSRYLNEDYPAYAEQLVFDEALERYGILDSDERRSPSADELQEQLQARRLRIEGVYLVRSNDLPDLDSLCGRHLRYRDLIECGETRAVLGISNLPLRPESYNALYDLASSVLDPVIDYFGSVRLTYGFASAKLTAKIEGGIAPRLDQHAACEHTARGGLICDRRGAACDFLVEDEDMRDVADWIISNLTFDRLYFYGPGRPIHVSFSETPSQQAFSMVRTASGRLMPRSYFRCQRD